MNVNIQPNNAKKCLVLVLAAGGTIASSVSAYGGGLSPSVGITDVLRRAIASGGTAEYARRLFDTNIPGEVSI